MKVPGPSPHDPDVVLSAVMSEREEKREAAPPLDFVRVYDEWFDEVSRWARALGGPEADLVDLAQEVFLVVRRKLATSTAATWPAGSIASPPTR